MTLLSRTGENGSTDCWCVSAGCCHFEAHCLVVSHQKQRIILFIKGNQGKDASEQDQEEPQAIEEVLRALSLPYMLPEE